jgi:hypothetical protein
MQSNHQFLLKKHFDALEQKQPSPLSMSLYELYFSTPHNIDRKVTEFSSIIKQSFNNSIPITVDQNSIQELTFLPLAKDQMLNSFNAAVQQYEAESS